MFRKFFTQHLVLTIVVCFVLVVAGYFGYKAFTNDPLFGLTTTVVTQGDVTRAVSVSGIIESQNTAELAFPNTGIVSKVYVAEGSTVDAGTLLATLDADQLVAARSSAIADLTLAQADRDQLITGVRAEERAITDTTTAISEAELGRVKNSQLLLVENARRTLLNTTITAKTIDSDKDAPAPVISGTYTCEREGAYTMSVYASNAPSGYSFRLTGLETGTFTASTDQPTLFGSCGLFARFTAEARYADSTWVIAIPNVASAAYTQNSTLFDKAERDAKNAVAAATQALTLAQNKQQLENAAPRSEALTRANARVSQAAARVAEINAQIDDRTIIAPFAGMVTRVGILAGEIADTKPVINLLGPNNFELIARIPEIDVTRIIKDQSATAVFDADRSQSLAARVTYIAPIPTQINGVAYFEIKLALDTPPAWIRSGLNADIDVVIEEEKSALVVPSRYLTTTDNITTLAVLKDGVVVTTPVEVILRGTDGKAAVTGITEGTTIIAP